MNFNELTIISGTDKFGNPEKVREITIKIGEIYTIIGFTGSGKSQLIRDIEQLSQGDTITKRRILMDGSLIDSKHRYIPEFKIVAYLTQNMNYITDMKCGDFLILRATSRKFMNPKENVIKIIETANSLCGEPILENMKLTSLSGGQSRALMIADTAINAKSPIILIDEIENAGIDKKKAMEILVDNNKIVLVVTHDPYLALSGSKRIVMLNGGMDKLIETSESEAKILDELRKLNEYNLIVQRKLREGEAL
ncbi:MAG: ATP-binding cassette domain-containing protein [Acholeplasmatales bacterium]|jgi:ABC-type lipoprotein export system ATPase subunit|nr:ATP-binding cassette domain-containing protein [Acholeplasmatales bacterium]